MKKQSILYFLILYLYTTKVHFCKSVFSQLNDYTFGQSFENLFKQCLEIPNTLCVGGTTNVITSNAIQDGLVGKWTFDDVFALDYSSNNNHMHKLIRNGPSFKGHGSSGAFIGDVSGFVPFDESLKTTRFSITFWIYLLERSTSHFRNIISQINNKTESIAVLLHPHITKLSVRVLGKDNTNEGLSSLGHIPMRRWTHIAITLSEKSIDIYINGVFDNSVELKNEIIEKQGDLTIGKNSFYSGFNGYLDELHFFNRKLNVSEVKSFPIPSITGIYDTTFVHVGCLDCEFAEAMSGKICKEGYKLCSLFNLYNGAIHYARINGILTENSNLWNSDTSEDTVEKGEKRIGLCCKIYS